MLSEVGDLWDMDGDAICITTNCSVVPSGKRRYGNGTDQTVLMNIMGGGCAAEAVDRCYHLPYMYASWIKHHGTSLVVYTPQQTGYDVPLIMFPTKREIQDKATIDLVTRSAYALQQIVDSYPTMLTRVLLPRPGCGLGGLDWNVVQPILDEIMDDTIVAVGYAPKQSKPQDDREIVRIRVPEHDVPFSK